MREGKGNRELGGGERKEVGECSTAQYNTVQHSTVKYSTILY